MDTTQKVYPRYVRTVLEISNTGEKYSPPINTENLSKECKSLIIGYNSIHKDVSGVDDAGNDDSIVLDDGGHQTSPHHNHWQIIDSGKKRTVRHSEL